MSVAGQSPPPSQPLRLTSLLRRDPAMEAVMSASTTIDAWVGVEVALARGQAELGIIERDAAEAIARAAATFTVDTDRLWKEAGTVGYPILPLVRQLDGAVDEVARGRVHLGATTQDIMDTALAVQLMQASDLLGERVQRVGDAIAGQAAHHVDTVMAARTHAQMAVPTTFGAKLVTYLGEFARHRDRLRVARARVAKVSLFGAGGTSAAYGPRAAALREHVAAELGLAVPDVPWHVARDALAEVVLVAAMSAATCTRLAREVIDLSRNEIAELHEADGHHRGASSTMPQKANPIVSEAVIGLGTYVATLASGMFRAMEAGHERAAGEWQLEWEVIPDALVATSAALVHAAELVESWQVDHARMRANAERFAIELVAERCMVELVNAVGRERAHDLVYDTLRVAPGSTESVDRRLAQLLREHGVEPPSDLFDPAAYVGEAKSIVQRGVSHWERNRDGPRLRSVPDHGGREHE